MRLQDGKRTGTDRRRKLNVEYINVIGAGLAGCEAAWQIAKRGIRVRLFEMKPEKKSPAHKSDKFAELVCSNSLRNASVSSAIGLLKEEMRRLGSLIMEAADKSAVPAGGALAVDREIFSEYITNAIRTSPLIEVIESEVCEIPTDAMTVIATGPLTSDALADKISDLIGDRKLHFFDAAAPIVDYSSIDMSKAFFASRYGKGTPDYINCPMNEEEYKRFYDALVNAECAKLHDFEENEKIKVFEGCMPVEEMAKRGEDTLRFGPLKPVGIHHPETDERYYAVVQLRRENQDATMFNIVGFQTHLTFPEQKRVFGMIPGLENADFLRYGVMHRNTYISSPGFLAGDYSVRENPMLFFAGQMTGVEGYIESAASGFVAGCAAAYRFADKTPVNFTDHTMIGAMSKYVSEGGDADFQPMNANFGIIAPLGVKIKGGKRPRYEAYAQRALEKIDEICSEMEQDFT